MTRQEDEARRFESIWPGWAMTLRCVPQAVAVRTEVGAEYNGKRVFAVHRAEPAYLMLGVRRLIERT